MTRSSVTSLRWNGLRNSSDVTDCRGGGSVTSLLGLRLRVAG